MVRGARPCGNGCAVAVRFGAHGLLIHRERGVRVRAAGWGWRHAGRSSDAVSGLDLHIEPGERVLLLGASGAGKSTLLAGLAGVLGGDDEGDERGSLTLDGRTPNQSRGRVGLVLQDPDGQTVLARVGDEVAFGCENLGVERSEIWRRVAESLDAVGLTVPLRHPTSQLSGGQKQRLALASVLAMQPGLLLLDEPTANLDVHGVVEVRDAVQRVVTQTEATLVVVEHRVATWVDLVTRVIVLEPGGGVLADGSPDAVLGEHGAALAELGVWVPGHPPRHPVHDWGQADGALMLTARELAVGRRGFGQKVAEPVGEALNVVLTAGTATAVTGPNGAGKSTLALTLAGLLPPVAGELRAESALSGSGDRIVGPSPIGWRSRDLLTRIGTVFQDPEHQFLRATVRDELAVGPRALGLSPDDIAARIDPLLTRLRLDSLAAANPFTLSGGEKRRLSVATALATSPALLVVDEPTFGQDARTWAELVELFAELLRAGSSLLAVTHDAELIAALADSRLELPRAGVRT